MSEKKPQILSANLVVRKGVLSFRNPKEKARFEKFQSELAEGQSVQMMYTASEESGRLDMIAKIHAALRTLANDIGNSEDEMKKVVKRHGNYIVNGELESLADMSLQRLQSFFKTLCEVGEGCGSNLR